MIRIDDEWAIRPHDYGWTLVHTARLEDGYRKPKEYHYSTFESLCRGLTDRYIRKSTTLREIRENTIKITEQLEAAAVVLSEDTDETM